MGELMGAGIGGFCSQTQAMVPIVPNQSAIKIESTGSCNVMQGPLIVACVSALGFTNSTDWTSLTQYSTQIQTVLPN